MTYFDPKTNTYFENPKDTIGFLKLPTRPSLWHIWDMKAKVWIEQTAEKLKYELRQVNASIRTQIESLDKRRIRPIAEGDTTHLKELNSQIIALRKKLKK